MTTLAAVLSVRARLAGCTTRHVAAGLLVGGYLAAVYWAVLVTGGAPNPLVHFAYVAIVAAAMSFGWRGGLLAGIAAGVLLGPLMPDSTAASRTFLGQWGWMVRLIAYLAAGVVVGIFWERSQRGSIALHRRAAMRRASTAIEASEERLRRTIESSADGIVVLDSQGRVTLLNATVERFIGLDRERLLGLSLEAALRVAARQLDWANPDDRDALEAAIRSGRPSGPRELTLVLQEGRQVTIELRVTPLGGDREQAGAVLNIRDLTAEKALACRREARLEEARVAALVAMAAPSAAAACETLIGEFGRLWPIVAGAIYVFDPDGAYRLFLWSREAPGVPPPPRSSADGTRRLCDIAGTRPVRRPLTEAALPESVRDALAVAGGRSLVILPLREGDQLIGVFVATETCQPARLSDDEEEILAAFAGTATGVVRRARLDEDVADRTIRERIGKVLDRPTLLHPVFQPILDLASGRVAGYEALARFAVEPLQPPDAWFAAATRVGLGAELQALAVRRALEEAQGAGGLPKGVFLSLNVSPRYLGEPATSLAFRTELGLDQIVIEVTEEEAVADYAALRAAIAPYVARGARFAVDDAGAGYASMRHVTELRPAFVKLDAELIRGLGDDQARQALTVALYGFTREIHATLIAEGVEYPSDLAILTRTGLPMLAQGYCVARPGPAWPPLEADAGAVWYRASQSGASGPDRLVHPELQAPV
jgi:PAS domain S-box-containing protein